jgi:hypothetical protein
MRIYSRGSSVPLLIAIALLLLPAASLPQDQSSHPDRDRPDLTRRFDGKWQTTVSCEPLRGALGFSYQFMSVVKDGNFDGLHGTEGQPGFLRIEGTIGDDGTGKLYANGMTGSKEYVPGNDTPRGTEFGYHIKSHFDHRHGDGTRVEGRACTIEFEKQ